MGVIADIRNITGKKTINPDAVDGIPGRIADYLERLDNIAGDPAYPAVLDTKNELQSIAQFVPTVSGGTFTLTVLLRNGQTFTTAAIAFGASAATIESAIDASADGVDEVQSIAQDATDHTGGTFALTIKLQNAETFTTAGIAFNANAATIEGAIDTAATGVITGWTNGDISVSGGILQAAGAAVVLTFDGTSVAADNHVLTVFDGALLTGGSEPATRVTVTTEGSLPVVGWTNGDISVAGGDLNTAPVTLTFDGTSVAGVNHALTTADGSSLTGGGSMGAITETTAGQSKRTSWAVLEIIGATTGSIPAQGAITPITGSDGRHKFAAFPNNLVLRHLCQEADAEDGSPAGLLDALLGAVGLDSKNASSV